MYELYISPDLLSAGEWIALSKSLKWAEDRFPVLENTAMIGGAPAKGEAYGYVHFKGNKGILALRNPGMQTQNIRVTFAPQFGMDPEAGSLVLERVYPTHWISPDLYSAGATVSLPLSGYETAVYEVYPLDSARKPLVAGVTFTPDSLSGDRRYAMDVLQGGPVVKVLNPGEVADIRVDGGKQAPDDLVLPPAASSTVLARKKLAFDHGDILGELTLDAGAIEPRYVIFLHPDSAFRGDPLPEGKLRVDGKAVPTNRQQQKGIWSVYSFVLDSSHSAGPHRFDFGLTRSNPASSWRGTAEVWLITRKKQKATRITVTTKREIPRQPEPPDPYGRRTLKENIKLGNGPVSL